MSSPQSELNQLFENQLYLYFYEDILTHERTQMECEFVMKYGGLKKEDRLLDLACGHGRHANYFAELDYEVTGIDINKGFIECAIQEAEEKGLKVGYINKNILDMESLEDFDVAYLL